MNIALILAAGSGSRMGNTDKPKQFLPIYGKPLMVHTIEAFEMHDEVDAVVISTNEEYIDQVKVWCKQYDLSKVKMIVAGGDSRQISVYNGLQAVKKLANGDDIVLIHDSARPLISQKIISDNIKGAESFGAVDTVIHATDTIVESKDGEKISNIPNRKELYQGQTPQTFKYEIILKAHKQKLDNIEVTDDCKLVHHMGIKIHFVPGSRRNFKITYQEDLDILKAFLLVKK